MQIRIIGYLLNHCRPHIAKRQPIWLCAHNFPVHHPPPLLRLRVRRRLAFQALLSKYFMSMCSELHSIRCKLASYHQGLNALVRSFDHICDKVSGSRNVSMERKPAWQIFHCKNRDVRVKVRRVELSCYERIGRRSTGCPGKSRGPTTSIIFSASSMY